ncbi:MAG: ABC transporter permease [Holophagales bacterium]|jgi:ABC-2 type transport system permease protein|nr:ABC transporter permease [Holophagales bacterium]
MKQIQFLLTDSFILSKRETKHLTRRSDTMMTTVILPMILLLLFNYLFGGAMGIALGGGNYLEYMLPGILLMTIGYCATTTATGVNGDVDKGVVERFKSMPISRPAYIIGHIIAALIRNAVAMAVVIGLAFLIGFHSAAGFGGWLAALGIFLLFAFALSALAILMGLGASSPEGASSYGMPLMFLPYFTGAFVPIKTMPKALQVFCTHQPVNVVWETVSGLLQGNADVSFVGTLLWCGGIIAVSLILGGMIFARKTAK